MSLGTLHSTLTVKTHEYVFICLVADGTIRTVVGQPYLFDWMFFIGRVILFLNITRVSCHIFQIQLSPYCENRKKNSFN